MGHVASPHGSAREGTYRVVIDSRYRDIEPIKSTKAARTQRQSVAEPIQQGCLLHAWREGLITAYMRAASS